MEEAGEGRGVILTTCGTVRRLCPHPLLHSCQYVPLNCALGSHYVKTSNRSHNICNRPLTPVTCTHICNCCYLAPVTDKRGRSTLGLAFAKPITNVYFW
jgi:hypothetical protein